MKMFLISDNVDTQTGMRLAGVEHWQTKRSELFSLQKSSGRNSRTFWRMSASTISFRCSLKFRTVTVPEERRTLSLPL